MKRIIVSQLLLALLIPCCSLTAFASQVVTEGETSRRDVQYQEFSISREELEQGRVEACTVTVSQPYSYSIDIPKVPNSNAPTEIDSWGHEVIINTSSTNNNSTNSTNRNTNQNTNTNKTQNNGLVDIEDEQVPQVGPGTKPPQVGNKPVQTDDQTPIGLYCSIFILGLIGMKLFKSIKNK